MALLALPVSAHAAEGFVGVTERGSVVRFTSETPLSLTKPKRPSGMAPGERIVALGQGRRGVVAVGSSAKLYALDPVTARATPIGPSFPQGLRGSRFSLAAAPNSDAARLLSDVGQDLVVDLQTGATSDGPGLRRARDSAPVRPAADLTLQGALFGVQLNPAVYLRELARGTTTMAETPLETPTEFGLGEPAAFSLGSNGRGYVVAVLTDRQRDRQSALLTIDSATGRFAPPRALGFQSFARRLTTFTSVGSVPDDHTRAEGQRHRAAADLGARAARSPRADQGALERGGAGHRLAADRRPQHRLRVRDARHAGRARPSPTSASRPRSAAASARTSGAARRCRSGSATSRGIAAG